MFLDNGIGITINYENNMSESNIILYKTPNGQVSIQVQYEDGNFWLTQNG